MKKYYVLSALIGFLLFSVLEAEELFAPETYASYYGEAFNGKPTSSGEIFDMNAYTAAHKTLPFGTILEVTNLENGKKVVVRVNDRGPFVANREIDLSKAAAESLGMITRGITRVSIKRVNSLDHAAIVAAQETYSTSVSNSAQEKSEKQLSAAEPKINRENNADWSHAKQADEASNENSAFKKSDMPSAYTPAENNENTGILWRIQLGAFSREENALRLVVQLRKIGLEPAYERTETSIRVVLPGISTDNLNKVKEKLATASFTDYVIRQESW